MRLGWLSTGRDAAARSLLADIVARARADELPLDVSGVFCDRERGESEQSDQFLDLVDSLGFAAVTLSSAASWRTAQTHGASRQEWRVAFHDEVMRALAPLELDVLVLAGYMLVVSPAMCTRYAMLNLHPALPGGPTGTWQAVIWSLLEQHAEETGAMIHLVTPELDRGPVLTFDRFTIVGGPYDALWAALEQKITRSGLPAVRAQEGESEPLFAAVRRQGEAREIPLLYRTIAQFVRDRLRVRAGSVSGDGVALPLDLTTEVDAEMATRP